MDGSGRCMKSASSGNFYLRWRNDALSDLQETCANKFRPFCSEHCRMVDLGTWAGENYRVPGAKVEDREHPDDIPRKKILH